MTAGIGSPRTFFISALLGIPLGSSAGSCSSPARFWTRLACQGTEQIRRGLPPLERCRDRLRIHALAGAYIRRVRLSDALISHSQPVSFERHIPARRVLNADDKPFRRASQGSEGSSQPLTPRAPPAAAPVRTGSERGYAGSQIANAPPIHDDAARRAARMHDLAGDKRFVAALAPAACPARPARP